MSDALNELQQAFPDFISVTPLRKSEIASADAAQVTQTRNDIFGLESPTTSLIDSVVSLFQVCSILCCLWCRADARHA